MEKCLNTLPDKSRTTKVPDMGRPETVTWWDAGWG